MTTRDLEAGYPASNYHSQTEAESKNGGKTCCWVAIIVSVVVLLGGGVTTAVIVHKNRSAGGASGSASSPTGSDAPGADRSATGDDLSAYGAEEGSAAAPVVPAEADLPPLVAEEGTSFPGKPAAPPAAADADAPWEAEASGETPFSKPQQAAPRPSRSEESPKLPPPALPGQPMGTIDPASTRSLAPRPGRSSSDPRNSVHGVTNEARTARLEKFGKPTPAAPRATKSGDAAATAAGPKTRRAGLSSQEASRVGLFPKKPLRQICLADLSDDRPPQQKNDGTDKNRQRMRVKR